jgi:hypothetical protein
VREFQEDAMRSKSFTAMLTIVGAAVVGVFLALQAPVTAHHAIQAEFDTNKTEEITGTLTRFAMINPHVRWYFEETIPDAAPGAPPVLWEFTASGPGAMRDAGLARIFVPGETYHVTFAPANSGANVGRLRTLTFPNGRTVTLFHQDPTKLDVKLD